MVDLMIMLSDKLPQGFRREVEETFVSFMDVVEEFKEGTIDSEQARDQMGRVLKEAVTRKILTEFDCHFFTEFAQTTNGHETYLFLKEKMSK